MADQLKMKRNNLLIKYLKNELMIVVMLIASVQSKAQHFRYEASIPKVDSAGFYAIDITPEVSSHIKTDFSDISIMDEHNTRVPFIIKTPSENQRGSYPDTMKDRYIVTPQLSFVQKDSSDKFTYITVTNEYFYHIEKVELKINAPKYFKRKMTISNVNTSSDFELSSGTLNNFDLPAFNTKKFIIKIENEDNPPLFIKSITTYQAARQLIAYLDGGKTYNLFMGDGAAQPPSYELQNFKDSIPAQIKSLTIGEIKAIAYQKPTVKSSSFSNKTLLWVTFAVMLAVLLFFTLKLTKDVKKAKF